MCQSTTSENPFQRPISNHKSRTRPFLANILNKSLANHETCFICGELLSTVFASERILKLNCGDSTHSECFKAYFKEDIPHARIHGKTITFAKTCRGLNCSGTRNVVVDVNNWHLVSARKLSLIPRDQHLHTPTVSTLTL